MATVSYITPIMNRTQADVEYAKTHQNDLANKNKGAWNYTDANRVCNNLKYAAERMYEKGILKEPFTISVKLDWTEQDIITYEQLNNMIVNPMNNLYTYSRSDLEWYPIATITNMDFNLANWLERNIHNLATQEPLPPDTYTLTVNKGSGSGNYEARTVVTIQADPADDGQIFSHWSGDHLENIGEATAMRTTYTMPNENATIQANYTGTIPHKLSITTYTGGTKTHMLAMGSIIDIKADPAPEGRVFHHWTVEPSQYSNNLYEPAATTHFTMPNEEVSLTAVYITKGQKQLVVNNGNGSGLYEYDSYASVSSKKPANATFTNWTGDTQYLTGDKTQEYNSVKIPDVAKIEITAHWIIPPVTNVHLKVVNGVIASTGEQEGDFTQGDKVTIIANSATEGQVFRNWSHNGGGSISGSTSINATVVIGTTATTVTATYRTLEYHELTVTTHSGTTTQTLESYDYFSVDANPIPDGQTFDKWEGDTYSFNSSWLWDTNVFHTDRVKTGTCMGTSDRTITATYRPINTHKLVVKQLSGDVEHSQAEFSKISITAEDAPAGKRFTGWSLSGQGSLSSASSKTTTYTFGNGDGVLTPNYVNIWTITVVDGTINGSSSAVLEEGRQYELRTRSLKAYEGFDNGWSQVGPGTIKNAAATSTYFTVGNGDATLTAGIVEYPDKTLTIMFRNPDTNVESLVSTQTYRYGTHVNIIAPVAPDKTIFSAWEGDIDILSSALPSTTTTNALQKDAVLIATYYYPEAPQYYTLTVYNGYPESGSYKTGQQISIRANTPSQGYEFYKWYGDTQFLVNPDLTLKENSVIIPSHSITLRAKYTLVGELPTFTITVANGTAKGTYTDSEGNEHTEESSQIKMPAGTEITLTADPDTVGYTFDHWVGNFEQAGVTDIIKTNNPTVFTMVEDDLNIEMKRRELDKYDIVVINGDGSGEKYVGTYEIKGNLQDTDDKHYTFIKWTCVDANGNDCINAIEDPTSIVTNITLTDRTLYATAHYQTHYKLTVIKGQDTGDGYYYEGEKVNSVTADTLPIQDRMQFDYWDDPMGVIKNIYDPTPTIIMKDGVATITAIYVSIDEKGNSVVITGDDLHSGIITRSNTSPINGIFAVGTIVFDKDGCIGMITKVNPDSNDDTDDYEVKKLFYGGNF